MGWLPGACSPGIDERGMKAGIPGIELRGGRLAVPGSAPGNAPPPTGIPTYKAFIRNTHP